MKDKSQFFVFPPTKLLILIDSKDNQCPVVTVNMFEPNPAPRAELSVKLLDYQFGVNTGPNQKTSRGYPPAGLY